MTPGPCSICGSALCLCESCIVLNHGICQVCWSNTVDEHNKRNPPLPKAGRNLSKQVEELFKEPVPLSRWKEPEDGSKSD